MAFAERQHATRGLLVHPGRLERELRPAIDVDKGTVVRALVAEHDEQHAAEPLRALAAFGDDVGDLPAFAALEALRAADGPPRLVVRVAAVDTESPAAVAAAADLSVPGASGAVALLRDAGRRHGPPDQSALSGRHLVGPPVGRGAPAHRGAQRRGPCGPRRRVHGERGVQRVGRAGYVEGIDPERAATAQCEFLPGAGLVREHEDAVGPVEQRPLLGHEVEAVAHGVDQQHVREGQDGERAGPVVLEREHNGRPAIGPDP